jgi:hypothetical protein
VTDAEAEKVARAIAVEYNLDPDATSPRAARDGHLIPEWMFFLPAARAAEASLRQLAEEKSS